MNKYLRKVLSELAYYSSYALVPPSFITLNLTWRCNYRCPGCSSWNLDTNGELSDEEWLEFASSLKQDFSDSTFIEISGGEALIKSGLTIKIITELKKHFQKVSLNSNSSLVDETMAQKLEAAGLDILKLSFYSLDKEAHNFLRGVATAHDDALASIEALSLTKIKIEIGILITKQSLPGIIPLIKEFSAKPNIIFNLQSLDEKYQSEEFLDLNKNTLPMELWPEKEETAKLFSWLHKNYSGKIKNNPANLRLMEKYYYGPESVLSLRCFTGQKNLIINPDGQVLLCFKRPLVGNIRKESIKDILKSARARKARTAIKSCRKYCRIKGCNFSRGLKELFYK